MIDIKFLRENPDVVRASQKGRGEDVSLVDQVIAIDEKRRVAINEFELLRKQKNGRINNIDKKLLEDLLIKNMINRPEALLPNNQTMRADVDLFVVNAYQKLYNRSPNELEVFTLKKNINENAQMTAVMVYYAMMTSDEYRYY